MVHRFRFISFDKQEETIASKKMRIDQDYRNRFLLEKVPKDLHAFLTEKMSYRDFANLNFCNSFTAEMCNSLPITAKLPINVSQMRIVDRAQNYKGKENFLDGRQKLEKFFPKNVHYICEKLTIDPIYWNIVVGHRFTVNFLWIYSIARIEKVFFQNILQLTKAKEIECGILDIEALDLPEVKQLKSIELSCPVIDDDTLLNLPIPTMTLLNTELSLQLVKSLVLQWIHDEREIVRLELGVLGDVTPTSLRREFESETGISIFDDSKGRIWFCKENHEDCLNISREFGFRIQQLICPRSKNV